MPSKLFCVATQHDLRRVLPRSPIKKLFGSFSRKRTETPFFVTFLKKEYLLFSSNILKKRMKYSKIEML